jgi:hypothetical protein
MWQTPLARELLRATLASPAPPPRRARAGAGLAAPPQADCALRWIEPPRLSVEQGSRRLTFRLHQQTGDSEGGRRLAHRDARGVRRRVIESHEPSFKLTAREAEVLYWVVKGKINRDIGDILGASPMTVKKHLERIYCVCQAGRGDAHRRRRHGDGRIAAAASAVRGVSL